MALLPRPLPTKPQYPVDGRFKKDFKLTSDFGYRVHPITKAKKHHNGADLWGGKEPLLVEAFYDGVVIAKASSPAGFGHYVVLRHKIDGKSYTSLYAHLKAPSKLRLKQRVDAGAVIGIMGTSGASTGKHLHFEIGKGATHPFISGGDGSRYMNPLKFVAAVIKKWEAARELALEDANGPLATSPTEPVQSVPAHSLSEADRAKAAATAEKAVAPPVKKTTK